ncbi:MAG: excinuclease ABC subunit UvrA [Planctomycetes bacterium]|nr:excinuclease ABC subunit UvrA [Planctomycetota bacterium]
MPASAPGDPELPHALRRSDSVCVVGARQHNLKNVTVAFPRGKTTVCCGPSGSGKSSFAIDTVYAEGQRRYVESLSAYARQFLSRLSPAKVEHVTGLSPAICIEQKTTSKSPRSTVGTITEIYDYLRVLWTRLGVAYCPKCLVPISTQTSDEIVERILALGDGARVLLLAPVQPAAGETYEQLLRRERENGYRRARVDGALVALDADLGLDHRRDHRVELVVDRVALRRTQASRLADSVEQALSAGNGVLLVSRADDNGASSADSPREQRFSQHFSCAGCGRSYQELTPHHFSFNTRQGWCEACEGLGVQQGASPASIIVRPSRSLLDGAVAGWENVRAGSKLHALIAGLADHIGFDAHRAWNQLTETQRLKVLHGCGEDWITPRGSSELNDLRFRWRGFYPAVSRATSISWQYRKRLEELVTEVACEACSGGRLRPESAAVRLFDRTLPEVCRWPLSQALAWFDGLKLSARQRKIAGELLHEVTARLRFLVDVGLDYVALGRTASTLSGGESQRIQLASQIGTGLTGVLYVLDEPTIGLHPRDNARLILALRKLRDLGNTLLLVEHDREVIESADHVLDFGPGAGAFGGEITAAAAPGELRGTPDSLTGRYLSNREAIPVPTNRRFVGTELRSDLQPDDVAEPGDAEAGDAATGQRHRGRSAAGRARDRLHWLVVHGARQHNLREIDVAFPLGRFVCVTGVSGSGKSTLVTDILYNALAARIHRARVVPGAHERISGVERIDKVINVDQSPLGLTPTSNPATYTGVFDAIRELYAKLPLSKVRGYTANRFSFNRPGGRCEACEGMGQRCIEMHFLPDVWVECENCRGTRYVPETLEVRYREKSIADVLEMRIAAALECFENVPKVRHMLQTLDDVGLGYLTLGQAAPTLSGGEAQRVKLAAELGRPSTGKTLYILDEPTTGLHFDDLRKLLNVLHRLVDLGNTVICIEHNLDVIKTADWLIDLGPEGGAEGGCVVLAGTPEQVAACTHSHTGAALVPVLTAGPRAARAVYRAEERRTLERALTGRIDISAEVQMPWQRDGKAWHTVDHVDFQGAPTQWDPKVLSWLVDTIESLGAFAPTDWNHRSRVEIKAPGNLPWFCHFLTGSKDLLELALRVPAGTFAEGPLARQLAIKALDERRDLPIYGGWSRLAIRAAPDRWQDIRLYLRDFQDVKKSVFRAALKKAAEAYFARVTSAAAAPENEKPWTAQGLQWHLSQKSIRPGRAPQWRPDLLLALVGRFKAMQPDVQVNWTGKTAGQLLVPGEPACAAKIVTNAARGLRVDLRAPRSALTPVEVERLGEEPEIRRGGEWDWILFWVKSLERCDARQLREVWRRCRTAADDEGSGSP